MQKFFLILPLLLIFTACGNFAEVKVEVVSERTALENQVLGTYNAIDREMLLTASVRGVDANGQIKKAHRQSQEHQDALAAMQVIDFHADDLQSFKQLGWVGENRQGLLTSFDIEREKVPESLKLFVERYSRAEFDEVVNQINQARKVLMQRVIDLNENLSNADMDGIGQVFGKLNTENALPGEKIQMEDGHWGLKQPSSPKL